MRGGQIHGSGPDLESEVSIIDGLHDVPSADSTDNNQVRDVAGNKIDAAVVAVGTTKSIVAYVKGILSKLLTGAGKSQMAVTTIDLEQGAASYDLFTGTDQAVIIESLVIQLPNVDVSDDGNLTSISIQTDDVTPAILISTATGDVANLTAEAQLGYTGIARVAVGTKVQLTIAGGAADDPTVCNVVVKYRSAVDGGTLV